MLLITHEMEVVKTIASQVAVIDRGRIVEEGTTFDIFTAPKHETTRSLLSSSVGVKLPHWVTWVSSRRQRKAIVCWCVWCSSARRRSSR